MAGMEYPPKDSVLRTLGSACCTCVPGVLPLLRRNAKLPPMHVNELQASCKTSEHHSVAQLVAYTDEPDRLHGQYYTIRLTSGDYLLERK